MSWIKRCGLIFFSVVLIFACMLAIISLGFSSLLHPAIYIEALRESGAFGYVETQIDNAPMAIFIKIPAGGVEVLINRLFTNTLAYLRSDSNALNLSVEIDQTELRAFFLQSIENVSLCAAGQEPDFDNLDNSCRRPGQSADSMLDELLEKKHLNLFSSATIDLVNVYGLEEGSDGREKLDTFRSYVGIFYYVRIGLFAMIILVILIIILLNKPNYRAVLRLTGISLLIASGIVIALAAVASPYIVRYASNAPIPIISSIVQSFAKSISSPFYLYSSVAAGIGIMLCVLSFFMQVIPHAKRTES